MMGDFNKTMLNKICIVTGATSGIGRETAKALAFKGAHVVIIGRNSKKCIATVSTIQLKTGNPLVDYVCTDLSDLKQVYALAGVLKQKHQHIDVLVNNAGAYFKTQRYQSVDGYEMTLALNYLSPFLLTSLLMEKLHQSNQARIINVSSDAHLKGKIRLDDLQSEHNYNGFNAYAQSKLALLLFTYELAQRLKGTTITVNAVHPGLVATNFGKNNGWLMFQLRRLIKKHEISESEGSKTSIYLATSSDVAQITGGYFSNKKRVKSYQDEYDKKLAKQLWEISETLTTNKDPNTVQ